MKQFARCKNCQQWYARAFTTVVEICKGDMQRRQMVWCLRCIAEAENRSWFTDPVASAESLPLFTQTTDKAEMTAAATAPIEVQQLFLEHTHLMDQALHAEEAVLIPRIKRYLEQCQLYQGRLDIPEHSQRLAGHQHYWEAFLKVLK